MTVKDCFLGQNRLIICRVLNRNFVGRKEIRAWDQCDLRGLAFPHNLVKPLNWSTGTMIFSESGQYFRYLSFRSFSKSWLKGNCLEMD